MFSPALLLVDSVADFLGTIASVLLCALLAGYILARLCGHQVAVVLLDLPALLSDLHILDGAVLGAAFLPCGDEALVLMEGLGHLLLHRVTASVGDLVTLLVEHSRAFLSWYGVEDCVELRVTFPVGLCSTFLSEGIILDREVDQFAFFLQKLIANIASWDVAAFGLGHVVVHGLELGLALLIEDRVADHLVLEIRAWDLHILAYSRLGTGRLRGSVVSREYNGQDTKVEQKNLHLYGSSSGNLDDETSYF